MAGKEDSKRTRVTHIHTHNLADSHYIHSGRIRYIVLMFVVCSHSVSNKCTWSVPQRHDRYHLGDTSTIDLVHIITTYTNFHSRSISATSAVPCTKHKQIFIFKQGTVGPLHIHCTVAAHNVLHCKVCVIKTRAALNIHT